MTTKSFGDWVYERVLGAGSFGQVELWKQKYSNKRIAIKKCMLPSNEITSKQAERWKQEIYIMQKFQHPNIVKALPVPDAMSFIFPVLCMEFCNKGNLRKVLEEPTNACGLLERELLSVMKDISSALMYLHYNSITHRDLKPENIVLQEKNNFIIYKLIDLGFAKKLGNKTTTASLVGTFNYVAPELFLSNKYTCSVDYWSLGILFFEVLTGYKPFIPQRHNFLNWMKSMENKTFNEICAKEIDGGIQFYDHIIHPTDLSQCILNKLVDWFKIALQWDPKKRGKHPVSNENIFFSFMKEIFPKVTIYIFSVALYQIDKYNVNSDIKLAELQQYIEQRTGLPVNNQIIANINGKVLHSHTHSEKLTLQDIPDLILYVYNSESLEVTKLDGNWEMPGILNVMLMEPEKIKDRSSLRQCYTSLIYIKRFEVNLFKQYIFALGTKYDIVRVQMNILNTTISESLVNITTQLNKVKEISELPHSSSVIESLNDLLNKIENLYTAFNTIKNDVQRFGDQMNEFFIGEKLLNNMNKYTDFFEYFLNMFGEFEAKRSCSTEYISLQINLLQETYGEFDELKENLLKDGETVNILRNLIQFEKNLLSYKKVIEAGIQLVSSYEKNFLEISTTISSNSVILNKNSNESINLVTNDDVEIRDNIVLRSLVDEYLKNVQETWSKMKSELENLEM